MKKILFLLVVALSPVLLFGCGKTPQNEPVACTMEAKLCPDGSSVGRVPPSCEFAACPDQVAETPNPVVTPPTDNGNETPKPVTTTNVVPTSWKTYTDRLLTFKYPVTFDSDYIGMQEWPPKVTVNPGVFSCPGKAHVVDDRSYCVTQESEGAAGSSYITYHYLTNLKSESKVASLEFTLRLPQCANYPETQMTACKTQQDGLKLDQKVDQMVQTIKLAK